MLKYIIESKHKLASVKDARGQGYTKDVLEAMMASTTEGVNLRRVADRLKEKSRWEQKLRDIKGRLFPDGCLHEQEAKKRREEEAERANAVRGADVANKLGIPSASADWPDIRHYLNDFFQISKKVVENNGMWWISSGDMKEEVVCVAERIKHWSEQHRDKRTELFKVLTNLRVALRNGVQCDIIIT